MTMIKTYVGKEQSCEDVEKKFNDEHLIEYQDDIGMYFPGWGKAYDSKRRWANKDSGRTYYHFVIAPDPRDHADLEAVRKLAMCWALLNFTGWYFVIAYRTDDIPEHINAHVVVSSVHPETRKKLQLNNRDVARLSHSLQSLSNYIGLHWFNKGKNTASEWIDTKECTVYDDA